jgi:hypothetical protein
MLVATWRAQGIVTTSTKAATGGEAIADVIDHTVRTAAATAVLSDRRLDVQLGTGGCASFAVVGTTLYFKATGASGEKTGQVDTSWTRLSSSDGVGSVQQVPDAASGLKPYFAAVSGASGVTYSFRLTGAQGAVDLISTVLQRSPAGSGVSPCFS